MNEQQQNGGAWPSLPAQPTRTPLGGPNVRVQPDCNISDPEGSPTVHAYATVTEPSVEQALSHLSRTFGRALIRIEQHEAAARAKAVQR
jgi:hypothetical protein